MFVRHLESNFNIVFILCSYLFVYFCETTETSGPFRTTLVRVSTCETPYRPYVEDSPMTFTPLVHNTSTAVLLSGNVTISKDIKNIKFRIKGSVWESGKWRPNYRMNDISCHSTVLHLLCTAAGINYDKKNCMFLKGQYNFKNLDINPLQHLWASNMEYGRLLWRSEMFHPKQGTYFCHDFETLTEPI